MNCDVIIVGAGVAGLMSALELAEAGASCCLIDKNRAGSESSWAGGGILSPLYPWNYSDAVNQLAQWGAEHYPDFLPSLQQQTGIDPEWVQSGHLILDEQQSPNTPDLINNWANRFDTSVKFVNHNELLQLEPHLAASFNGGIWLPHVGQVRNPRLIKALKARVTQLKVPLHERTEVKKLLVENQRITGIQTTDRTLKANQLLVTAGAWSGTGFASDDTDIRLPAVKPVKGQMIQFQTEPGTIRRINLYRDHYVIPRKDGKVLAGSTLENTQFDKSTDKVAAQQLQAAALELFPALASAPVINHWAGLRPGNDRQTPFIGEHPAIKNLYFNTGHFRNGIILGLASARLVADLILQRQPLCDPTDFALA